MVTWTNHDRHALDEWLSTDLGHKFLAYLEQEKPPFPEDTTDLNAFALAGAVMKGYTLLLQKITSARKIVVPPVPPVQFIDTSDNPKDEEELSHGR